MAILLMLGWWYGQGWLWVVKGTNNYLSIISKVFAVRVLLKTWLAPWKQIYSPLTFNTFLQTAIDNAVSRVIGGVVRTFILFCALVLAVIVVTCGITLAILWPLLPLSVIILPLLTISGVTP